MNDNIALQIARPENCILALTFPMNKREFEDDLANSNKEFVRKHFNEKWSEYTRWVLDPLEELVQEASTLGVVVSNRVTTAHLANVLRQSPGATILVLFAHHDDRTSRTELFDGLRADTVMVDCFPQDLRMIVDLVACESEFLRKQLEKRCNGKSLIRCAPLKNRIFWQLRFYKELLRQLARSPGSYLSHYEALLIEFLLALRNVCSSDHHLENPS